MIDGVQIIPLKIIPDERGAIMHGVRKDNILNEFGEVYFSRVNFNAIKGWHVHETMTLNYICVYGQVRLVLHDLREQSPTRGETQEILMGPDNYCLAHIPPGVANGVKGLWSPYSLICNVASEPHDPNKKMRRIHPDEGIIRYDWGQKIY